MNNRTIIAIASVTFLTGALAGLCGFYVYNKTVTLKQFSDRYVFALSRLPSCESENTKQATDLDFVVYNLKYNEVMIPQLEKLLKIVKNTTHQGLIQTEISREKEEVSLLQGVYKIVAGKEYQTNVTSSLIAKNTLPVDSLFSSSTASLSDSMRMDVLRGFLEYNERNIYSFEFLSKNQTIKNNALEFIKSKEHFVSVLTQKK